jgi:hypothetical protein
MPAEVDEVLLERRLRPGIVPSVGRDARVDRVEVLDDVVDGQLA